jgi:hypothetical protein
MYGYIYKTVNKKTKEIYIGKKALKKFRPTYHGAGKYIKNVIKKYGEDVLKTTMLCEAQSKEELNKLEKKYIKKYKKKYGDRCVNKAKGGDGGNVFEYATEKEKEDFTAKMTDINRERCRSDEFKENCRKRMKDRYSDPKVREEHSKKIRKAWSDETLRKEQSKRIKESYKTHPKDSSYMKKRCRMTLNGEVIEFESAKDMKKYFKDNYGVVFDNSRFKKMLDTKKPYEPFHKNKPSMVKLRGMVLEYLDYSVETSCDECSSGHIVLNVSRRRKPTEARDCN